jgi:hypothetical protein
MRWCDGPSPDPAGRLGEDKIGFSVSTATAGLRLLRFGRLAMTMWGLVSTTGRLSAQGGCGRVATRFAAGTPMTVKETGRRGNVSGRFNIEAVMSDTVHVDDALDFMVRKLAEVPEDQPPNNRPSGYNVKILDIAADYWWQRNRTQLQNMHSPEVDPYYKPVCDATWRLCLMNVLRPGYASLTLEHFRIRLKSESAVIRDPPTSADSTRPEDAQFTALGSTVTAIV